MLTCGMRLIETSAGRVADVRLSPPLAGMAVTLLKRAALRDFQKVIPTNGSNSDIEMSHFFGIIECI